ncbi:MAG: hypothetical protein RIS29_641 [Bacteroidota bacterium]|jgi:nucleoid DNA-binding protein
MSKEKISSQEIIDHVSAKASVSKRAAEEFLKVMISTIEDALLAGEPVKIKGFGTFKLQWNEPRKSVNVQTGEEFVLDGYYKVTFAPEASLKELVNEPFAHLEPVLLDASNNFVVPEEPVIANDVPDPLRVFAEQASEINDLLSELRSMSTPITKGSDEESLLYETSADYLSTDAEEDHEEIFVASEPERTLSLQAEYVFDDDGPLYDTDDEIAEEISEAHNEVEGGVSQAESIAAVVVEPDAVDEKEKEVVEEEYPLVSIVSPDFESDYEPVMVLPLVDEYEEDDQELLSQESAEDDVADYQLMAEDPTTDLNDSDVVSHSFVSEVANVSEEDLSTGVDEAEVNEPVVLQAEAADVDHEAKVEVEEPFVYVPRVAVLAEDKPTVVYDRNEDDLDLEKTPFMQGAKRKRRKTAVWVVGVLLLIALFATSFVLYGIYQPVTNYVNETLGIQPARVTVKVAPKPKPAPKVTKTVVIPKDTTQKDTFKVSEVDVKQAPKAQKQAVDTLQQLFDKRSYENSLASEQAKKDSKLTALALKYYGHKDFWVYIYEANKERIDDPEHLMTGTLIRIPKLDKKLIDPKNPKCISKAKDLAEKNLPGKVLK